MELSEYLKQLIGTYEDNMPWDELIYRAKQLEIKAEKLEHIKQLKFVQFKDYVNFMRNK